MKKKIMILMAALIGVAVALGVGTSAYASYYQTGWTCPSC